MLQLIVTIEDTEKRRKGRFVFDRSPVHIGRSELNDLVLPLGSVSLWHGVIHFDDDGVRYVDTRSRNGTELGKELVKPGQSTSVEPSDVLSIKPLQIRLVREQAKAMGNDNAAQREQLFSGVVADFPAVPGQTKFFQVGVEESAKKAGARGATPAKKPPRTQPLPRVGDKTMVMGEVTMIGEYPSPPPTSNTPVPAASFAPLEEAYTRFWSSSIELDRQLEALLGGKTDEQMNALITQLLKTFPRLAGIQPLESWTGSHAQRGSPSSGGSKSDFGLRLINQFASSYVANHAPITSEWQLEAFIDRVAHVLETFSKGFIELRRGYESLADQLGLETSDRDSRLAGFEQIPKVLEYLLDENQPISRVAELTRGFAGVMIHEVALMGGVRQGVRAVLKLLGPEQIKKLATRRGAGSLMGSLVPAQKHWAVFSEQHEELMGDEERLSQTLFGRAFARAYAVVALGREDEGSDSED